MKNKKPKSTTTFREAVESTPDIANGYKAGLAAMGRYRHRISAKKPSKIEGSVDIDTCTTAKYPNDNRWDYTIAYNGEVFFIEVHSAHTSEVKTVLRKLQWLKDWLNSQAPGLNKLKASSRVPYIWIQSKNVQIPKTAPQYLQAVKAGIFPVRNFELL